MPRPSVVTPARQGGEDGTPPRLWLPLALLLAGALTFLYFVQKPNSSSIHAIGTDDAYITFRYAENLLRGHGLVFNPGERVEGYSNLLWLLMSAVLLAFVPRGQIMSAVAIVNLALLVVLYQLFRRRLTRGPTARFEMVALSLLALSPSIWIWTRSGLETIAVLVVQVWLWVLVEEWQEGPSRWQPLQLGLALTLAVLLRSDGFVAVVIVTGYWLWQRQPKRAGWTIALAAPAIVLTMGLRWVYFGALLPNVYYAKVEGAVSDRISHAVVQLSKLAIQRGLLVHLVVVGLLLLLALRRSGSEGGGSKPTFGAFFAGGWLGYWLIIGGDHFGERFLLLLIPVGIAGLTALLAEVPRKARNAAFAAVFLVQLSPLVASPVELQLPPRYDGWIALGRYLEERYDDELLAVGAIGKIPFFSGLQVVDMRGLTDPYIARLDSGEFRNPGHNNVDPGYVISRRPDLIAVWIRPGLSGELGMTRKLYRAAGYELAILVNATPHSMGDDILDVRGMTPEECRALIQRGYRFGVLERVRPHEEPS